MGWVARWLRGLLGGGKKGNSDEPKKRWGFGKSFREKDPVRPPTPPLQRAATPRRTYASSDDGAEEQNKRAIAVAAATAAVAEAAVAAAQAAAAVVRLTSSGRCVPAGAKHEEWAAVRIQAAFRGYLARRALKALRGLVKLQALVRGNIVRRQAAETLRCMQALVSVQSRARASRVSRSRQGAAHPVSVCIEGQDTAALLLNPNQDTPRETQTPASNAPAARRRTMSSAVTDAAGDLFAANLKGALLAVASSAFVGVSFIVKKKGLRRAGATGSRAGVGGYGYLWEPLWWVGMVTMLVGETANFVAYMFAPAVLVAPLGALSIIVSAVLAHFMLNEKLQRVGVLGCVLCIVGSTVIILHAPEERSPSSVEQIWRLATQPTFLCYAALAVAVSLFLMLYCAPRYGQANIMVYVGICSVIGSLTVMSIKAVGIAIKLTIQGENQAGYFQTWLFVTVSAICLVIQLVYLNKALDTFNTALVSPIYYAMFTTLTILASGIMFKDWSGQSASVIASETCGFLTVLVGIVVLHSTKEPDQALSGDLYTPLPPKIYWHIQGNGGIGKQKEDDSLTRDFITVVRQDYFV